MSAETLSRIMDETGERLAVARYGAETQAIGLDHMTKIGADLAEAVFTTFRAEPFTNAQINVAILDNLDGLARSIIESFEAFGADEDPFLDRCLEAASSGFLDRAEVLFEAPETGGRA